MAISNLITENPVFKALLPWAKAIALAESTGQLCTRHVLQAALWQVRHGQLSLPPALVERLAESTQMTSLPELSQPVHDKIPLSDEFKLNLATSAVDGFDSWLGQLVGLATVQKNHQHSRVVAPEDDSPEFHALKPWLAAAMQVLNESALSLSGMALAIHHAVEEDALKEHLAFAHWCEGHADELTAWLKYQGHHMDSLIPVADSGITIEPDALFLKALADLDSGEVAQNTTWKWAHAAINAANQSNRRLQIAYHEAGHAVALHVLSPESLFSKITIEPEGNTGGHVTPNRNNAFDQIYLHSLEHAMESIVVALAGRAAEVHKFGNSRADSGAISDIRQATLTAWQAITAFGLDPQFGLISLADLQQIDSSSKHLVPAAESGWLQVLAQQRLHAWLRWGMQEASALVEACWPALESLALDLMKQKTQDNATARKILGRWYVDSPPYVLRPIPVDH